MRLSARVRGLAAVLSVVSLPAFAVEMPDAGTKNFSAPSETPSYFTNENGHGSPSREPAGTEEGERDVATPIPPPGPEVSPPRHAAGSSHGHRHAARLTHGRGRHGRYANAGRHGTHFAHAGGTRHVAAAGQGHRAAAARSPRHAAARTKVAKPGKQTRHHA